MIPKAIRRQHYLLHRHAIQIIDNKQKLYYSNILYWLSLLSQLTSGGNNSNYMFIKSEFELCLPL